ncbi:hypothetical protein [Herbaspirillum robiniae]|uniref:hypothetical protein n=1 Tax=Herbaspirillum robiniae TaxID=2014887 RepID=UPI0011E4CB0D|nr:hypothetical protein [Herbaspirillum robiniae]
MTYAEYMQASLKVGPGKSGQQILMGLFQERGIKLIRDTHEAAPPMQFIDDEANGRFVLRQIQ